MKGPTQYNFANDNSTLNATQIVNYIDQRKIPVDCQVKLTHFYV